MNSIRQAIEQQDLPVSASTFSQISLVAGDELADTAHFPAGKYDMHGQQVDLRTTNSWVIQLDEITLPEIVEVQLVNVVAPTILISQLKLLMAKGKRAYIINVSAIEGQFASAKNGHHPHTNMAKAALNMLTYSSAADFAEQQAPNSDVPEERIPLDEEDAAARICDPIFMGENTHQQTYGKLLKDYSVVPW